MSDMRDTEFNGAPRFVEDTIPQASFEDTGGLDQFHTSTEQVEEGSSRSKLLAGIAVAVVVGAAGAYAWTNYSASQPKVADSSLPSPTAPTKTAAMAPPAPIPSTAPEAKPPTDTTIAPAPRDEVKPEPVTKQAAASTRPKVARVTQTKDRAAINDVIATPAQVQQQAAVQPMPTQQMPTQQAATQPVMPQNQAANVPATVPEAVSPTPPASAVASNPAMNEQSATPAPEVTPQAVTPQATQAAPAPETQTAPVTAPTTTAPAQQTAPATSSTPAQ